MEKMPGSWAMALILYRDGVFLNGSSRAGVVVAICGVAYDISSLCWC
jgi:hypothetical protein